MSTTRLKRFGSTRPKGRRKQTRANLAREVSDFPIVCIAICNVINGNGRSREQNDDLPGRRIAAISRPIKPERGRRRWTTNVRYVQECTDLFLRVYLFSIRARRITGDASRTTGSRRLGRPEDREPRDRGFPRSSPSRFLGECWVSPWKDETHVPNTTDGLTTDSILDRPVDVLREPRAFAESVSLSLFRLPRDSLSRSPKWVAVTNHAFASSEPSWHSLPREFFWTVWLSLKQSPTFLISIFVESRIQRAMYKISFLSFIFLFFNSK